MNFRSSLFMLGLLLAVGALVYFGRKGPGTEDLNKKNEPFWKDAISDKITRIELKRGEETLVLERDEARKAWNITSPFSESANGPEVERIKSAIDFLKPEETFDPGDPKIKLKEWELDPPKAILTVKGTDFTHVFRLGALLPTKHVAMQLDDRKETFMVQPELYNATVEKKTSDFRNRKLLAFDTYAVDRLTLTMQGQDVEVAYLDGSWRLVRPVSDRADAEVVNEVLRITEALEAKEYAEDDAKEMKKYGLDVPVLKVSIVPRGQPAAQVVLMGGPKEGDKTKVYARRENSNNVVTVEANDAEKLKRTVDDLRDKRVFEFEEHEIVKVSLERLATSPPRLGGPFLDKVYRAMGHVRREAVFTVERPGDTWMMTEPAVYPFDIMGVAPWLTELKDTRVVEFRDSEKPYGDPYRGGADAELVLVLERRPPGTSVSQRLAYPLIPLDANKSATWRPNGDRVLAIGSNLIERLKGGPVLFRRKMLLDIKSAQVTQLSIETRSAEDVVSKVEAVIEEGPPRTWRLLAPAGGALDEIALTDVLNRIGTLVAKGFLSDDPVQARGMVPANPLLTFKITFGSEMAEGEAGPRLETLLTLTVGQKGDNGYTAVFDQELGQHVPVAFILDEATFHDLTRKVLK